jgi:hypothetical protein
VLYNEVIAVDITGFSDFKRIIVDKANELPMPRLEEVPVCLSIISFNIIIRMLLNQRLITVSLLLRSG